MDDGASFCAKCGNRPEQAQTHIPAQKTSQEHSAKGVNKKAMVAIIAAVIVIVAILLVFIKPNEQNSVGDSLGGEESQIADEMVFAKGETSTGAAPASIPTPDQIDAQIKQFYEQQQNKEKVEHFNDYGGDISVSNKMIHASLSSEDARLQSLLPESNEVTGWIRGAEIRFFDEDNLYEFINGAAENFLNYGFKKVVTVDYDNAEQTSPIIAEIYQMADARNAFGIYSSERNINSTFKNIGEEGYIGFGGTALNFCSENYYVKITVFQENEALQHEMKKIADVISRRIGKGD